MIKKELSMAIMVAILGIMLSFAMCNIFLGPIEDVKIKTLESSTSASLVEPDENIFNFNALNPTVEVYVGNCENRDNLGRCLDKIEQEVELEEEQEEKQKLEQEVEQNKEGNDKKRENNPEKTEGDTTTESWPWLF